ncbi:hypothetical protein FPOAC2_09721 [Fusarium poae]|uniref:hypothetical protein n=1 Tax=Fusarium poae TaxID=36050 RepID=UPI001CE8B076|nr:hypothetical protein FPOAC1_009775 [Fusarium poae]KAG8670367.1 hypothetical protein FPOAC1_009775 [Fusarium poae]
MDAFQTLPAEICVEILVTLHQPTYITSVINASPSMLATYNANKNSIRRRFYENEFGKDLMQHALGLILFPPREPDTPCITPAVERHVQLWQSRRLTFPNEPNHSTTLESIDRLYRHIRHRVQSFMSFVGEWDDDPSRLSNRHMYGVYIWNRLNDMLDKYTHSREERSEMYKFIHRGDLITPCLYSREFIEQFRSDIRKMMGF